MQPPPPDPAVFELPNRGSPSAQRALRLVRLHAAFTFSFAWIPVMYTAFTRDRGFSPSQYAELWAAYYFAMVLAELPTGWIADRFGQRRLLVAGPLWLAACFALLGHADTFSVCRLAMMATGAGHAMISGADSAYLYELLRSAGLRGSALREESHTHRWRLCGVSLADLAGGFVAWSWGTSAAFDLSVAAMLAATVAATLLPTVRPASSDGPSPGLRSLLAGLGEPGILWVMVWYASAFVLLRVGFQLYQPTLLAAGATDLRLHGGLLCLLNLVAASAALFVGRVHHRLGERGTTTAVLLAMAVSFAGLGAGSVLLIAPLCCLQQVSFGFLQPVGRTSLNHRVRSSGRTAILSAQSMVARLAFAVVLQAGSWDRAFEVGLDHTYGTLALAAVALALACRLLHRAVPLETRSGG